MRISFIPFSLTSFVTFTSAMLFAVFFSVAFTAPVFAQEEGQENTEFVDETGAPYQPPVLLELTDASYASSTREVSLDVTLNNTANRYFDNLEFHAELYRGDALAEEGVLFDPLEYITVASGNIPGELAPQETANRTITFTPPGALNPDTYFIRLLVNDTNLNFQVVDYTETPLTFTGDGGFLPFVRAYFRAPDEFGGVRDDHLNAGWGIHGGEDGAIVIPLAGNAELAARLKQGEKIYAHADIYYPDNTEDPVKQLPKTALTIQENTQKTQEIAVGEEMVMYNLPYGDGVELGGPYSVYMYLTNEEGKQIQEIQARWLVDDNAARIVDIETATYRYDEGDSVEIQVPVAIYYYSDSTQTGSLAVTIAPDDGEPQMFTQDVALDASQIDRTVQFSSHTVTDDIDSIDFVRAVLTAADGTVLDEYRVELKEPVFEEEGAGTLYTILITLGVLIVLLVALVVMRRLGGRSGGDDSGSGSAGGGADGTGGSAPGSGDSSASSRGNMALSVVRHMVVLSAVLFVFTAIGASIAPQEAAACWHRPGPSSNPSINTWIQGPSSTTCGERETFKAYMRVSCGNACINGLHARLSFEGSSRTYSGGHVKSQTFGPIVKRRTINSTKRLRSNARITRDGCWCKGAAGRSDSDSHRISCTNPDPKAWLNGPREVDYGDRARLEWNSRDASRCNKVQGPGFSTRGRTSGSDWSARLTKNTKFVVRCDGPGGHDWDAHWVRVNDPNPSVNLSASPSPVDYNQRTRLQWNSSNARYCTATQGPGFSTGGDKDGSDRSARLTSDTTFKIKCTTQSGKTARDSVRVRVGAPPQPSVSLSASPNTVDYNTSSTLSWNTTNADSCSASGDWSGGKSVSEGSENTGNLTSNKSYTLQCSNAFGSDTDSASVSVRSAEQCQDGVDNDGDGWVDMNDPGCSAKSDDSEANSGETQCQDGIDNDGDGLIDGNDPNCATPRDDNEVPDPDFSLDSSNNIEAVFVGGGSQESIKTTITVNNNDTFTSTVSLSVINTSPSISGAEYNWGDSTLDSGEYDDGTPFSVVVPSGASPGEHTITIEGQGGGLTRVVNVILNVDRKDPDFEEF